MHIALTWVQVLVTRTPELAHWLAHFCWGLLIVTTEKGKAIKVSHSDARSLVSYLFLGFHIVTTGNVFLCLTMIQKRKNIKTLGNLINTHGLRPLVQIRWPRVSMLFIIDESIYITLWWSFTLSFQMLNSVGKVIKCMLEDKSPIGIKAVQIETKIICRYI
jgi:hypothetical protein